MSKDKKTNVGSNPSANAGGSGSSARRASNVRIAGVVIPQNKRVIISLRYIYGVGPTRAEQICKELSIPLQKRVYELEESEISAIRQYIETNYVVEGDLRNDIHRRIKELMDIKCYRGMRHIRRLPVRGQRTHTNARTRKGKRVAIAGKKKTT